MKRVLIVCVSVLIFVSVFSQEKNLVQLTGRILNEQSIPLPFAHVLVLNNYKGTITDYEGKFSFVVEENDTIMFSNVGYKRKILIVPESLPEPFLTLDIHLEEDTIMIAAVEIYPWKSYEEFKEAFLNLKLPEDDMDRARKNIALIKTQIILDNSPNPQANFKHVLQEQYNKTFIRGQYPTYQLFNAVAWAKFFEALQNGDFKNNKDD
ncbi:MAG: carboxypeptidase-like regulatory domain-containing protein [Bacteroidales bacterium]|nr:carboxypeptidase-like regulatory domain-containing protein [Bacteroidales bacterium]